MYRGSCENLSILTVSVINYNVDLDTYHSDIHRLFFEGTISFIIIIVYLCTWRIVLRPRYIDRIDRPFSTSTSVKLREIIIWLQKNSVRDKWYIEMQSFNVFVNTTLLSNRKFCFAQNNTKTELECAEVVTFIFITITINAKRKRKNKTK